MNFFTAKNFVESLIFSALEPYQEMILKNFISIWRI